MHGLSLAGVEETSDDFGLDGITHIPVVEPMLVLVQEHVDLVTAAALERERQKSVPRLLEARRFLHSL